MKSTFSLEPLESRQHLTSVPLGFADVGVASGLNSPTAAELLPDGRILVAEQAGSLRVVANGSLLPTPALTLTNLNSDGERGLLGVAADPNFSANHFVYLYYTTTDSVLHNRVSRFTLDGDTINPSSEVQLANLNSLFADNHNGGALHFGPDGMLYVASGDNATSAASQSFLNRFGKLLRINPDGSIPTDNPFYNTATGDNRSIYALGLRNPFSFAFQPTTGRLLIDDVGESTYEEIDEGVAGANYGWPNSEGPTTNPSYRSPIYSYTHADGSTAITAGTFYNPAAASFGSSYVGSYFFTDLTGGYIKRLSFNPDGSVAAVTPFATNVGALVDLDVAPDGSLYYLDIGAGQLRQIRFAPTPPTVTLKGPAKSVRFDAGKSYSFSATAKDAAGAAINAKHLAWQVTYLDGATTKTVATAHGKATFSFATALNRPSATGFYRISLTATDLTGTTRTLTRDLKPHTAKLTLRTSAPGLTASATGHTAAHQFTLPVVVGSRITLTTAKSQIVGLFSYQFLNWSDRLKQPKRTFTMPAKPATITAIFKQTNKNIR